MSEAKVPYCKRIRDEIRFLSRLEKFVYERTSPYVIDKQVELINRAHEDGVKVGRASRRDGLRKALISIYRNTCCEQCQQAKLVALAALEADGEGGIE